MGQSCERGGEKGAEQVPALQQGDVVEPRQLVGQPKHHTAARTGNPAMDTATSSQAGLLGSHTISCTYSL